MRISTTPGPVGANRPIDDYVSEAQRLEEMGFDTLWMVEIFGIDPIVLHGVLARETSRIKLGTAIAKAHPRHPVSMAQQAMTVNAISNNRFTLGIGPSHQPVVEFMYGLSYARPAAMMREYLTIVQDLAKKGSTAFQGEFYRANASIAIAGHDQMDVCISALAPAMLRLAGELADGTLLWMTAPEYVKSTVVPTLREVSSGAGRPMPRVVAGLPVCVTDDPGAAREAAAQEFAMYGQLPNYRRVLDAAGKGGPADLAIIGTEAEVHAKMREVADAGVDELWAAVFAGGAEDKRAAFTRTYEALASWAG